LVAAQPDITLDELQARLAEQAITVGRTSVQRCLERLGLTRKKRHSTLRSRPGPTLPRRGRSGGRARRA
jgi:transposase